MFMICVLLPAKFRVSVSAVGHCPAISLSIMMGCMMENTMKPTLPPISDDHHGLEHRGHARERDVDLAVVGVGDVGQHLLELAGALADRDHVGDERRELAAALERRGDALALADVVAGRRDDLLEHPVAEQRADDVEGLQQLHAAGEHRRQRAGEAGDRQLAREVADDRELEQDGVAGRATELGGLRQRRNSHTRPPRPAPNRNQ
jgi:hypothetical protein